jgi:RNA polymerase sigma factor (sigma-70 family)
MDPASRTRLLGYAMKRFEMREEDAEDLLQETAVDLLRQRIHVRKPNGFVFSAFHLRCCRFIEIQKSRRQLLEKEWSPPQDSAQPEKIEHRVALKQAMQTISVPCRRILRAYYVEGLSLQETARAIAAAYGGVWTRIDRCLRRLRQCLQ